MPAYTPSSGYSTRPPVSWASRIMFSSPALWNPKATVLTPWMVTRLRCAISSTCSSVCLLLLSLPSPITTSTRRGSIGSPRTSLCWVQAR